MNADVKALWTARLRSGQDEQTKGALKDNTGSCCLGVLSDIAVEQGVIPEPIRYSPDGDWHYGADEDTGHLPIEVQEWAGLPASPKVPLNGGPAESHLTDLNDGGSWTFPQLADLIDKEL